MQGFNMGRYVPPELEGTLSANQVSGKHALGSRARKAAQGILTVRFEMPFGVWCSTCPKPTLIGQGVRFNAEKRKAGNYYSTPIWAFRMKHQDCGGWIEIRTDPKNTEYEVVEGGQRRDTGDDRLRDGDLEIRTEEERKRLQEDAFAALEVTIGDRKQAATDKDRIEELYEAKDRDWSDPFAMNKRLRKTFRAERKDLEAKAEATENLKDKMSLGIHLLPESDEDRLRASHTSFGQDLGQTDVLAISRARGRDLFGEKRSGSRPAGTSRKGAASESASKLALQAQIRSNTRSSLELFGTSESGNGTAVRTLPGIKRKRRGLADDASSEAVQSDFKPVDVGSTGLVQYDSE